MPGDTSYWGVQEKMNLKNTAENNKLLARTWKNSECSDIAGANRQRCSHSRKQSVRSSNELSMELPRDPAISPLRMYPREFKTHVHAKTCPRMFMAPLLIAGQKYKQPTCRPTDEWINKLGRKHTMKYYSPVKRNENLMPATTWTTFKNIVLSRRSQAQRTTYCIPVGKSLETGD